MTKRELEAIRALPDEYVCDGTELLSVSECPVAVNGVTPLLPITYIAGKWHRFATYEMEVKPRAVLLAAASKEPSGLFRRP